MSPGHFTAAGVGAKATSDLLSGKNETETEAFLVAGSDTAAADETATIPVSAAGKGKTAIVSDAVPGHDNSAAVETKVTDALADDVSRLRKPLLEAKGWSVRTQRASRPLIDIEGQQ